MLPVNLLDRTLISDPIRETQGFRMICDLRRPARGGEWRFCRSVRRIERPAKSKNRERRKHGGNAAVNYVSSDSVSCLYGGVAFRHSSSGFFGQGCQKSSKFGKNRFNRAEVFILSSDHPYTNIPVRSSR